MHDSDEGPLPSYIAGLARIRAAAGALFRDESGKVLVVHPTYKDHWDIPGGMLEKDESPYTACTREITEELGITPDIGPLLCVDWVSPRPPWDCGLMFVFDGGVLGAREVAGIRLDQVEIDRIDFVPPDELDGLLGRGLAARIRACARNTGTASLYLEDGFPPGRR
ncbi:NUDIX domain-containing protein [Sphaerisporangium viridialbum]|uniref:NUDIX domain-containing protein n=1 Tax=Sphaerisporangium viridialbum TaxID=46189 RepID=UPI003C7925D8